MRTSFGVREERGASASLRLCDRCCSNVQSDSVDERQIVSLRSNGGGGRRKEDPLLQHHSKVGRCARGQVAIYCASEVFPNDRRVVGEDIGNRAELGVYVDDMRVGEGNFWREGAENDITELDATRGYSVAYREIIFRKEFREVVKEDEEEALSATEEATRGRLEARSADEGGEELEHGDQQSMECRPAL